MTATPNDRTVKYFMLQALIEELAKRPERKMSKEEAVKFGEEYLRKYLKEKGEKC